MPRFIEDNWLFGERIQPGGSFDTIEGTIEHMFDFDRRDDDLRVLMLDPATGAVVFRRTTTMIIDLIGADCRALLRTVMSALVAGVTGLNCELKQSSG